MKLNKFIKKLFSQKRDVIVDGISHEYISIYIIEDVYPEINAMRLDGLDEAVIGISIHDEKIIYSRTKIIKILVNRDLMSVDKAYEFFNYNIERLSDMESGPIFCCDYPLTNWQND